MSSPEIDRLVEEIYDGMGSGDAYAEAIAAIQRRVGAHACLAFSLGRSGVDLWCDHEIDQAALAAYQAHYHQHDLYKDALLSSGTLRSGFVFTEQTLLTPRRCVARPWSRSS